MVEYAERFCYGGIATAFTGLIASRFGPEIGGLFLAFPAIFPAAASLVEKHERQKKERAGFDGRIRGSQVAGVEAAGTVMGCMGLIAFGIIAWKLIPCYPAWIALGVATLGWLGVSVLVWRLCRRRAHS
jgi:Flp pilus assembly protein TadB